MKKPRLSALEIFYRVIIVLAAIEFLAAIALIQPWMESQVYNRLTGANTTVWDAIWLELRVNGEPK